MRLFFSSRAFGLARSAASAQSFVHKSQDLVSNQSLRSVALSKYKSRGFASRAQNPIPDKWLRPIAPSEYQEILPVFHDLSSHGSRVIRFSANRLKSRPAIQEDLDQDSDSSTPPLLVKTPSESFIELTFPFSTDASLRETYRLFETNGMRFGRILEDLDAMAADVAYNHVEGKCPLQQHRLTLVTARADFMKFNFQGGLVLDRDLRMRGYVTHVGTSSLEVRIEISSLEVAEGKKIARDLGYATFTMVALNKQTQRPQAVPRLQPITEFECQVWADSIHNKEEWKKADKQALSKQPPSLEESELIHNLFMYTSSVASSNNGVLPYHTISDTRQTSLLLMQAQERNIHKKIFGGYLMRLAVEHSYATATMLLRGNPKITGAGEVTFHAPVPIGSILSLKSEVVYTHSDSVLVKTWANVIDTATGTRTLTDEFRFSFSNADGQAAPLVVPTSYAEAMDYLDGRRAFAKIAKPA